MPHSDAQLALGDAQMEVEKIILDHNNLPVELSHKLAHIVNLLREASSLLGDIERTIRASVP